MNQLIANPSNQSRIGQASIPMTKEELGFIHKNDIHATNQIRIIIYSTKENLNPSKTKEGLPC